MAGGNIGRPLLADAEQMTPDDLAVLELSSFQLMDMPYSPQVAVLTNLAPNHLDVHRDMAEYIASKENIYLHQSARDTAIFNADNAITRDLSGKAVGRARLFSRQDRRSPTARSCAAARSGCAMRQGERGSCRWRTSAFPAGTMWKTIWRRSLPWTDLCAMRPSAASRGSLPVWSTASSSCASCTASAITTIPSPPVPRAPSQGCAPSHKVVLIAGGYDKHIPFAPLAPEVVEHVKTLILCGATADAIERAVVESEAYETRSRAAADRPLQDLREAVDAAYFCAESGDVVTLSPACAAFDCYANFMERGRAYKEMVKKARRIGKSRRRIDSPERGTPMRRYMRRGMTGREKRRLLLFLVCAALIALAVTAMTQLRPILTSLATARLERRHARREHLGERNALRRRCDYDRLISLEKDNEGHITAVKSNMAEFNRLQSAVLADVLQRLSEVSTRELAIPLGEPDRLAAARGPRAAPAHQNAVGRLVLGAL